MSSLSSLVRSIADQLRGVYRPQRYADVILPMTILRRLDCVLTAHRDAVANVLRATPDEQSCDALVRAKTGLPFSNASSWSFSRLTDDPRRLEIDLVDYIAGFSKNIDMFARLRFADEIHRLAEKNRLLIVVRRFADVDLHPDRVGNAAMGDLFEELIRTFAEASDEISGEHFTPRDVIRLVVDLLLAGGGETVAGPGGMPTVYDPTAGTGGMLCTADERLREIDSDTHPRLYGQEINDKSYAICKSDMIVRGQDASNIRLGDTLAEDLFAGQTFDYCLANPPYGVDWRASRDAVARHIRDAGERSRFPGGLPPVNDGQMLFLQHLVTKMRPAGEGGGRAGIVLSGSPLFAGGAGSGPSEIRRWLLEHDLIDAIVALPTDMFSHTGIATYVWILDNAKHVDRAGTVQLIDATGFFTRMRQSLGRKNREIAEGDRRSILELYGAHSSNEHSRILPTDAFAYWKITVERPLRDQRDEIVRDRRGNAKADPKLRDTENVPFGYGGNEQGRRAEDAVIQAYVDTEVAGHLPDAWVDAAKTKIGYAIPFTRHFSLHTAPRPLEEIERDLDALTGEILELLGQARR